MKNPAKASPEDVNLGRELARARKRAQLTQAQVAARMKTTQSAIARMESGTQALSIATLRRYAEAVGARAVVLIGFPEDAATESQKASVKERSGVTAPAALGKFGSDELPAIESVKYTGTLAHPIQISPVTMLRLMSHRPEFQSERERRDNAYEKKWQALFKVFGLPFGDYGRLAVLLAYKHVPGFAIAKAGGHPRALSQFAMVIFRIEVEDLAKQKHKSQNWARLWLAKQAPWKKELGSRSPATLKKHYENANKWLLEKTRRTRELSPTSWPDAYRYAGLAIPREG